MKGKEKGTGELYLRVYVYNGSVILWLEF